MSTTEQQTLARRIQRNTGASYKVCISAAEAYFEKQCATGLKPSQVAYQAKKLCAAGSWSAFGIEVSSNG